MTGPKPKKTVTVTLQGKQQFESVELPTKREVADMTRAPQAMSDEQRTREKESSREYRRMRQEDLRGGQPKVFDPPRVGKGAVEASFPGGEKTAKQKRAKLGDQVKTKGSLPSMRYC